MAGKRLVALMMSALLSVFFIGGFVVSDAQADDCTGPKTISIIGVTDFHGHIENATLVAQGLEDKRAENPNTLFVSVGDNVGASAFESSIDDDNPSMDILKAMGLIVSATGNHEFDQGGADLVNRIIPRIGAPYISSNISGAVPDPVNGGSVDLSASIQPYYIHEVDGIKIAFVGAVTETLLAAVSPALNTGITVDSIASNVNTYADQLKDGDESNGEADVVVVLVHEDGVHTASGFTSSSIDAVLSGHTHLAEQGITAGGAPYVEARNYGYAFADLEITVACDGSVSVDASMVATDGITPDLSNPTVAAVNTLYQNAAAYAQAQGSRVLGCVEEGSTFNRGVTTPGTKSSEGGTENRGIQSTLGQLEADIALWTANQNSSTPVDIAFINSGGLRTDLDAGGTVSTANDGLITLEEAHNVTPFGNTNAIVTLTGAQLKSVLEQQWQPIGARRPVLWLGTSSNVTYNYIPYAIYADGSDAVIAGVNADNQYVDAEGHRVYPRGEVIDLMVDGQPVDPSDTFRVAGNSFLLAGGDDFTTFSDGTDFVDTGYVDFAGVMDYLAEFTSVSGTTCETGLRSPEVRNTAGLSNLVIDRAARTASVDVSGLTFSTDEPVPAGAYVAVNGVPFGYASPITRQSVPTLTQEMGALTLRVANLCDADLDLLEAAASGRDGIETARVILGTQTDDLDAEFTVPTCTASGSDDDPAVTPTGGDTPASSDTPQSGAPSSLAQTGADVPTMLLWVLIFASSGLVLAQFSSRRFN